MTHIGAAAAEPRDVAGISRPPGRQPVEHGSEQAGVHQILILIIILGAEDADAVRYRIKQLVQFGPPDRGRVEAVTSAEDQQVERPPRKVRRRQRAMRYDRLGGEQPVHHMVAKSVAEIPILKIRKDEHAWRAGNRRAACRVRSGTGSNCRQIACPSNGRSRPAAFAMHGKRAELTDSVGIAASAIVYRGTPGRSNSAARPRERSTARTIVPSV